jgi:hypothetical protein
MDQEHKVCEAADYGYSDCENPATTSIKIDGDKVPACQDCAEAIRELYFSQLAKYMRA